MSYALQTLLHERMRYAAGVGAVAFSALLIALQVGLLLGLFELTSIPIDHTSADIWIGSKDVESVDLGRAIPISYMGRLDMPGVSMPEPFYLNFANWTKQQGGTGLCMVLGSSMRSDALGAANVLTPEMRNELCEPMTVVVDQSDMGRLGIEKIGDTGMVNGHEVRVVGTVSGLKSLAAPWVFCSLTTAQTMLSNVVEADEATYLLARTDSPEHAQQVVQELKAQYPEMSAYTADQFSTQSRLYWLRRTKAGAALGYAALLGLLVGAVITAQTLYAATMASAREFATLLALGIPRSKVYGMVMMQSFWVGIAGVILAGPFVYGLARLAESAGSKVDLRWEVVTGAAVITLVTALVSGLFALRSVRKIEPMSLLR